MVKVSELPRINKTFNSSLTELKEWLLSNTINRKHWHLLETCLQNSGMFRHERLDCELKYVPGHKTDKQDSAWICRLLLADLLKPSYIPKREQCELRGVPRYHNKLI